MKGIEFTSETVDFAKKGGFRVEKMWWILEIFHEIFGCNLFPPKMGC